MVRLSRSPSTPAIGSAANGPPPPERRMIWVPIVSYRFMTRFWASSRSSSVE